MLEDSNGNGLDRVEYPCSSCGAVNRIPRPRIKDDPKCGRCKQSVFPDHPVAATDMLQLQRGPLFLDKQVGALPKSMIDAWLDRYV